MLMNNLIERLGVAADSIVKENSFYVDDLGFLFYIGQEIVTDLNNKEYAGLNFYETDKGYEIIANALITSDDGEYIAECYSGLTKLVVYETFDSMYDLIHRLIAKDKNKEINKNNDMGAVETMDIYDNSNSYSHNNDDRYHRVFVGDNNIYL